MVYAFEASFGLVPMSMAFNVRRSAFDVWCSAFGVRLSSGAVRTSVTLLVQDISPDGWPVR